MSGVGEAFAVVATVAAVITAYKDGGELLKKFTERRRARNALPPTIQLGEELARGEKEIEAAAVDGVDRFGSSFLEDDVTAKLALAQLTIELQATMLRELREAISDDTFIDFSKCIDASTTARREALDILHDALRRRKTKEASNAANRVASSISRTSEAASSGFSQASMATAEQQEFFVVEPVREPKTRITSFRFLHKARWSTSDSTRKPTSGSLPANEAKHVSPLFARTGTFGAVTSNSSPTKRPPPRNNVSDPHNLWTGTRSTLNLGHQDASRTPTNTSAPSRHATSPQLGNSQSLNRQPTSNNSVLSRRSTSSSYNQGPLSPSNDHGGFCKGAYELLAGNEKGLVRKNQSTSMTGESYYYACSNRKCAFEAPTRNDDVASQEAYGIKYRRSFFAKSHITQSNIKNGIHFKCLICMFRDGQSSVYKGRGALLRHVSVHQGAEVDGVLIEGPLTFSNQGIEVTEIYDLRFGSRRDSGGSREDLSSQRTRSSDMVSDGLDIDDNESVFNPHWEA